MHTCCDEEELTLAKRLRGQCNARGKELHPKVTAKLLHKLGQIYHKKKDKFSLIQSVALMTSAVLRRPDNAVEIQSDLDETCSKILHWAGSQRSEEFLTECVADIKDRIKSFRDEITVALKGLEKISDDVWGDRLNELRRKKVDDMRRIQNQVTETYRAIMKQIADYCVQAMGDPPCKYSLVGLGSLARRDITPFSDFEHVIVLENEVKNKENYADVLEYFRWFATIFQIILVRLGETLLTFLAIPSLNNPLDANHRWFYDDFTPCGISPDGMAPNASKTPLGCPPIYNGGKSCELIKPCDEMVSFFCDNDDPQMQLTTFCNVSGDRLVFEELNQRLALNRPPFTNDLFAFIIANCFDKFSYGKMFKELGSSELFDVKRTLYRSVTLYLAALGRFLNFDDVSCLDIVDHLHALGRIDIQFREYLCLCVAVSCEIRLQFYTKKQAQDDILMQAQFYQNRRHLQDIVDAVGAKTLLDSVVTTLIFQKSVSKIVKEETKNVYFVFNWLDPPLTGYLYICNRLKLYSLCNTLVHTHPERLRINSPKARFDLVYYEVDSLKGMRKYTTAVRIAKHYLKHIDVDSPATPHKHELLYIYGVSLHYSGKYKAALGMFRKVNFNLYRNGQRSDKGFMASLYGQMSDCFRRLGRFVKGLKYAQKELAAVVENYKNPKFVAEYYDALYNIGCCYRSLRSYDKCKATLQIAVDEKRTILPNELNDTRVKVCLLELGACHFELNHFEEALVLFGEADRIKLEHCSEDEIDLYVYLIVKGDCLTVCKQYAEAMSVYNQAVKKFEKMKLCKTRHTFEKLAFCWLHMSFCASFMGEHQLAMTYHRKSEKIREAAGKSAPYMLSCGQLQYSRGWLLFNAEKYDEALLCFFHKDCQRLIFSDKSSVNDRFAYHATLAVCHCKLNDWENAEEERKLANNLVSRVDWDNRRPQPIDLHMINCKLNFIYIVILYQQGSYAQVVVKVKTYLGDASHTVKTKRVLIDQISAVVHMAASLTQLLRYEESIGASESALQVALQICSPHEENTFESVIELLDNIRRCKTITGQSIDLGGIEFSPSVYWHAFNVTNEREPDEDLKLQVNDNARRVMKENPEYEDQIKKLFDFS